MRYLALATDYDGTIAHDGRVNEATLAALERLLASGRKLLLVTGRELPDLQRVFERLDLFEWVVAENGLLLYRPATRETVPLADPPPEEFVRVLAERGVPLSVGNGIVATWTPHETTVLEAIRELGLERQVIFNKGAVMVLPSGHNKCSGMMAALEKMGLSPHNVVGVGDAENDHAFLDACECAVAVANALPAVKKRADVVTTADHGEGVQELIEALLADDLASAGESVFRRRSLLLGQTPEGEEVRIPAYGPTILVAGPSGSGKSTSATGLVERAAMAGYQFCCFDPEGDYEGFCDALQVGDTATEPRPERLQEVLHQPENNAVVNLLGVPLTDRPGAFSGLLPLVQDLRVTLGRPHWLLIDEAHHMLPAAWTPAAGILPQDLHSTVMITLEPGHVSPAVLGQVDHLIAVGKDHRATFEGFCKALSIEVPRLPKQPLEPGEVLLWRVKSGEAPLRVRVEPAVSERRRHRRKYAQGDLGEEHSFYFRGPQKKLNLRAHNLVTFVQMAEGVDPETWDYHLRRGDIETWFRDCVKDEELAEHARAIAKEKAIAADESRERIKALIEERFTLPA